jgi:putative transposase
MTTVAYRFSNKTVCSAKYHIIWCPEYRRRVLGGRCEARLKTVIAQVPGDVGGQVVEVEVIAGHMHMLVGEQEPTGRKSRAA